MKRLDKKLKVLYEIYDDYESFNGAKSKLQVNIRRMRNIIEEEKTKKRRRSPPSIIKRLLVCPAFQRRGACVPGLYPVRENWIAYHPVGRFFRRPNMRK